MRSIPQLGCPNKYVQYFQQSVDLNLVLLVAVKDGPVTPYKITMKEAETSLKLICLIRKNLEPTLMELS